MTELRGEHLLLRPFGQDDAPALAAIAGQRAIADTMISVAHPFDVDMAYAWIEQLGANDRRQSFAVVAADGSLVGYAGLHDIDHEHGLAEISFWTDPACQGRGFAAQAAQLLLDHAFGGLGLNRVQAFHMTRNPASGRLLARLGFSEEGVMRQRVRKWDRFEDVVIWALLADDPRGSNALQPKDGAGRASE